MAALSLPIGASNDQPPSGLAQER